MAKFYFVRHGQDDYSPADARHFIGQGRDLVPLTEKGVRQLQETAKDPRLKGCGLILSSPYTRALQSAAILSKELQTDIKVEIDLHEWIPDRTFQYGTSQESFAFCDDFQRCGGVHPAGGAKRWETTESMRRRMLGVLEKYKALESVIVVCHGMVIRAAMGLPADIKIANGEVLEFLYE